MREPPPTPAYSMLLQHAAFCVALACGAGACGGPGSELRSWEGLLPVNGTELYVKRLGAGEPIVIVHGGPVLEHGYLLPHLAPLAESYELIFFDQRLSGRSAPRVDSASVRLATFVEDIEVLRHTLGLDRIHLMGHSWGGLLAIRYALEHQEHLISLVLLNSMSPSSDLWQEEERLLAQRVTARDSAASSAVRESEAFAARKPEAIRELLLLSFKTQFHDPARIGELDFYVPDDYMERSRQFGHMMVDLAGFDLHAELGGITVPTLVMYGSAEPAVTLGGSALREGLRNEEFVIIEDAGHFPFIEQPDVFVVAVRRFFDARR